MVGDVMPCGPPKKGRSAEGRNWKSPSEERGRRLGEEAREEAVNFLRLVQFEGGEAESIADDVPHIPVEVTLNNPDYFISFESRRRSHCACPPAAPPAEGSGAAAMVAAGEARGGRQGPSSGGEGDPPGSDGLSSSSQPWSRRRSPAGPARCAPRSPLPAPAPARPAATSPLLRSPCFSSTGSNGDDIRKFTNDAIARAFQLIQASRSEAFSLSTHLASKACKTPEFCFLLAILEQMVPCLSSLDFDYLKSLFE
ncbi:Protein of unknown function [Gryllus bimaculatus]|nr:Protein of unknown function [Gryllus bimaculatus]